MEQAAGGAAARAAVQEEHLPGARRYTSWLPTTTLRDRIYKKQEEEASMAAILWRKKLVLHKSLAGVSIGISQNPIMHANSERPKGSPQPRRGDRALAGNSLEPLIGAGPIRLRYGGRSKQVGG
ncbi:hypothetical protein HU200_004018 [Digitaria exilis]|uniref:Uncharacterized protein n=1 Tax=Digitaria exilis TaxID=1010633 RepID=A0A835KTS7_9POAL|nr:hypothetical protein HU200_004018 [Digitaria exilis]CAB3447815.1 unnamed protein product [Digitaria exilis]